MLVVALNDLILFLYLIAQKTSVRITTRSVSRIVKTVLRNVTS